MFPLASSETAKLLVGVVLGLTHSFFSSPPPSPSLPPVVVAVGFIVFVAGPGGFRLGRFLPTSPTNPSLPPLSQVSRSSKPSGSDPARGASSSKAASIQAALYGTESDASDDEETAILALDDLASSQLAAISARRFR